MQTDGVRKYQKYVQCDKSGVCKYCKQCKCFHSKSAKVQSKTWQWDHLIKHQDCRGERLGHCKSGGKVKCGLVLQPCSISRKLLVASFLVTLQADFQTDGSEMVSTPVQELSERLLLQRIVKTFLRQSVTQVLVRDGQAPYRGDFLRFKTSGSTGLLQIGHLALIRRAVECSKILLQETILPFLPKK